MNLKRACFKPFVPAFKNRTKSCDYILRWDNRRNKQNMRVVNKLDWNADSKSKHTDFAEYPYILVSALKLTDEF